MKKIIAVILLLVFTLQTFYTTACTVWFYANRKAIAKELCINKNQPELKEFLNTLIDELKANGELNKISNKWLRIDLPNDL